MLIFVFCVIIFLLRKFIRHYIRANPLTDIFHPGLKTQRARRESVAVLSQRTDPFFLKNRLNRSTMSVFLRTWLVALLFPITAALANAHAFPTTLSSSSKSSKASNYYEDAPIDIRDFGGEYGRGKDRATRRKNWRAFREACLEAIETGETLILADEVLEVEYGVDQYIELEESESIRIEGAGSDRSIIDVYPKVSARPGRSGFFFTRQEGVDIYVEGVQFAGPRYMNHFQTYKAILKAGGNNRIQLQEGQEIWSGLWSNLEPGDTLMYTPDYSEDIGDYAVIQSINPGSRTITLQSGLDGSIGNNTGSDLTNVGFRWPYGTDEETILKYSKPWHDREIDNDFILYSPGQNNYEIQGNITLRNTVVNRFTHIIDRSGGWVDLVIDSSKLSGIIIGVNYYTGDHPENPSSITIDRMELVDCGLITDGGSLNFNRMSAGTPPIWGSGFYIHPNVPVRMTNSYLHDNAAGGLRQYSSGGAASKTPAPGVSSYFEGNTFERNMEYSLLTSGVFPSVIKDCRFLGYGSINLHHSTEVVGCEIEDAYSLSRTNRPQPDGAEQFDISFEDCTIRNAAFSTGGWDPAALDKTTITFTNCDFHINIPTSSEELAVDLIQLGSSDRIANLRASFIDNTIVFPDEGNGWDIDNYNPDIEADPIPRFMDIGKNLAGEILIENLQPVNHQNRVFDGTFFYPLHPNNGAKCIIRNSDIRNWRLVAATGDNSTRHVIQLENTPFYGARPWTQFYVNSLPTRTMEATVQSSYSDIGRTRRDVLVMDNRYNTVRLAGGELRNIGLYNFNNPSSPEVTSDHRFRGKIRVVAQEELRVVPFGEDGASNIQGDQVIVVPKDSVITFQGVPDDCLTPDPNATSDRSVTLATGNGNRTVFSEDEKPAGRYGDYPIPGTVRLVTGSGLDVQLDSLGRVNNGQVEGSINLFNDRGGWYLKFDNPPSGGSQIRKVYRAYNNCQWEGYYKIVPNDEPADDPLEATIESTGMLNCADSQDGSITVNASGGAPPYTFNWSDDELSGSELNNLSAGEYRVTIADAADNSLERTIVIEAPDPLNITLEQAEALTCLDATTGIDATVTGGVSPYAYAWEDDSEEESLTDVGAGTYALTVTDANGCVSEASIVIEEPDAEGAPVAAFSFTQDDRNVSFQDESDNAATYQWSFGDGATATVANPDHTYAVDGEYEACLRVANACGVNTICQTIIVETIDPLAVDISSNSPLNCADSNDGVITASVSGGVPPYSYAWSENGLEGPQVDGLTAGTYSLTVTDAAGNNVERSVDIVAPGLLDVTLESTGALTCLDSLTGIEAMINGGLSPYSYSWDTGSAEESLQDVGPGTYNLTITDDNGCTDAASILIEAPNPEEDGAVAAFSYTQNGNTFAFQDESENATSYQWSFGDGNTSTAASPNHTYNQNGEYLVSLRVVNACGVDIASQTVTVETTDPLAVTFSTNSPLQCGDSNDGSISVDANGGVPPYAYAWSEDGLQGAQVDGLSPGSYGLTVTDEAGNSVEDTVEITAPEPLSVNITEINPLTCANTMATLRANVNGGVTPYEYAWSNGQTGMDAEGFPVGNHEVTITDDNGCRVIGNVTLQPPNEEAPVAGFTYIQDGSTLSFTDTSTNNPVSWTWSFGDGDSSVMQNPSHTYNRYGGFNVCLTVSNDCETDTYCELINLQAPPANDSVTFALDTVAGMTDSLVDIPVRVYNLENAVSFQMSIHNKAPEAGQFVEVTDLGLPNLKPTDFNLEGDMVRVSWMSDAAEGTTVEDGTVIFSLRTRLTGEAGECFGVEINGGPLPPQVVAIVDGVLGVVPHRTEAGEVCIDVEPVKISGNIHNEYLLPVPGVQVACSPADTQLTGEEGAYAFEELPGGGTYEIIPSKEDEILEGITSLDLILLSRHLLELDALPSPYLMQAADVNGSGTITGLDVAILQQLLLGVRTEISTQEVWRFFPAAYRMATTNGPSIPAPPQTIQLENWTGDAKGQDFIAIKTGDLDYSALIPFQDAPEEELEFQTPDQPLVAGNTVAVPITANRFQEILAYQMDLRFDTKLLEWVDLEPGALPDMNYKNIGTRYLEEGRISMVWMTHQKMMDGVTMDSNDTLFTLRFRAMGNGALKDALWMGGDRIRPNAYPKSGSTMLVDLRTIDANNPEEVAPIQARIYPNPNPGDQVKVDLNLPQGGPVTIELYASDGRLVGVLQERQAMFRGPHSLVLDVPFNTGLYFLIIRTPEQTFSQQFIITE